MKHAQHTRMDFWRVMQLGSLDVAHGYYEYLTTPVAVIQRMPLNAHHLVRVFHDYRSDKHRVVVTTNDGRLVCLTETFRKLADALEVAAEF